MTRIHDLEARRKQVLTELAAIRSLRKGSLNEQWFPILRNGKKTGEVRGPYFIWSYKVGKKTVSERIKDQAAVTWAKENTGNYRRFKELCAEFEELTAELGELERKKGRGADLLKKRLKSRSNKAKK